MKIVFSIFICMCLACSSFSQEKTTPAKPTKSSTASSPTKKPTKVLTPEEKAIQLYRSAELHKRMKKYEEAITDYSAAIDENPNLIEAFIGIASIKFLMINFDAALGDYNSAIDLAEKLMKENLKKAKTGAILCCASYRKLRGYYIKSFGNN